jgi:hypothetical protein
VGAGRHRRKRSHEEYDAPDRRRFSGESPPGREAQGARERKRAKKEQVTLDGRGKCEGRKSVVEMRPEVIDTARALNDGRSLRKIAAGLVDQGFVTPAGREHSASAGKRMLGEGGSKSRALKHVGAKGRRLLWAE